MRTRVLAAGKNLRHLEDAGQKRAKIADLGGFSLDAAAQQG